MKQKIIISGNNWNDILNIPCVEAVQKNAEYETGKMYIEAVVHCFKDGERFCKAAKAGDALVEDDDGNCHIEEGGQNGNKQELTAVNGR